MTTKVQRAVALNVVQQFTEHMTLKTDGNKLVTRANAIKDRLKKSFDTLPGVSVNDKGSKFFYFPNALHLGKKTYIGMENRRAVSTVFNEEQAERILRQKGVYAEALSNFIDQNKVIVLQQEGKLSPEDIDKMFEDKESWAFWPIEGEGDEE